MAAQTDVLNLFNALVVTEDQMLPTGQFFPELAEDGIMVNFVPNAAQLEALKTVYKPLPVETMFSREERMNAPLGQLLLKQWLHYVEVYGLGAPGVFELTTDNGTIYDMRYVRGLTVRELQAAVKQLLYTNAPVKDAALVKRIVDSFRLSFNINRVANNELRVILWNNNLDPFTDGDDAVRYLCYEATGEALLIKSRDVIAKVKAVPWTEFFFEAHALPLAQVFNRHKALILAAKNKKTRTAINKIARMSKTLHVPVRESIAKTFVAKALKGEVPAQVLDVVSLRDKLKYLNVLAEKRLASPVSSFKIRNGKVWTRDDRPTYDPILIGPVEHSVLASIREDLTASLKGTTILLDPDVDYGLPVSRKQTLGRLPFGTKITSTGGEISSGMYWENAWGAHDLDLSGVSLDGDRVGWGTHRGYTGRDIVYSGDVTNAPQGAMEFLTSRDKDYGIIVNIYSGSQGSEMELVVGRNAGRKKGRREGGWLDDLIVRERHKLDSRQCLLGFVDGKTFTVYAGRMNNRRVSGVNPLLQASKIEFWTVRRLFDLLGIQYDLDRNEEIEYDHDLSYEAFSYDKLERLFETIA